MKPSKLKGKIFLVISLVVLLLATGSFAMAAENGDATPSASPTASPGASLTPSPETTATPSQSPDIQNPGDSTTPDTTPSATPSTTPGTTPDTSPSPSPSATPHPGIQCGENVWAILQNEVLTLEGTGDMWNYSSEKGVLDSPFYKEGSKISKIVIGEGITTVGAYAFAMTPCVEVEIGKDVKKIEKRAFYKCTNLRSIVIPGNVDWIVEGAFRECSALSYCGLSEGVHIIGNYAFYGTHLTSITLPEGLQTIRDHSFANTLITRVTIPASVKLIEHSAFGRVNAVIYSRDVKMIYTDGQTAFGSGSTLSVIRNSKAETYAKNYGLKVSYLECVPVNGLPMAAHAMDRGIVVKEATCISAGEKRYTCTRCGMVQMETIPCLPHSFGEWKILSGATVHEAGIRGRECSVCGYTQTEEIEKLQPTLMLNIDRISLNVGETYKLKVIAKSKGDSAAFWQSSNKKIAGVNSSGKVTAKSAGTAIVTVEMDSGLRADVTVVVKKVATKKLSVSAKGAKLNKKKISVKARKMFTLVPKVTPVNTTDKVTYSSSKSSIVAVNASGKVLARKKGKAKITVKSGKKKVVITVTVK